MGGLGNKNTVDMDIHVHDASIESCSYLVGKLLFFGVFDIGNHCRNAKISCQEVRVRE